MVSFCEEEFDISITPALTLGVRTNSSTFSPQITPELHFLLKLVVTRRSIVK